MTLPCGWGSNIGEAAGDGLSRHLKGCPTPNLDHSYEAIMDALRRQQALDDALQDVIEGRSTYHPTSESFLKSLNDD